MGELKRLMDIVDEVNDSKKSSEDKLKEVMDLFGLNINNSTIKDMTNRINSVKYRS